MQTPMTLGVLPTILMAVMALIMTGRTAAQTFTTLHSFAATTGGYIGSFDYTNTDGANPQGTLTLIGNTLYGTTSTGGPSASGTLFTINIDGSGFTNIQIFAPFRAGTISGISGVLTNSEGISPQSTLTLSGNTLYGVAIAGGKYGNGTVFGINTDGSGFTNMHTFTAGTGEQLANSDGTGPGGALALSGNTLYGAAYGGGSSGKGTVFAINTDGTGFTNLHNNAVYGGGDGLTVGDGTLYGAGPMGGSSGYGIIFAIDTNGMGFTTVHTFAAPSGAHNTNSGGIYPQGALTVSGDMLYGTTQYGGRYGNGGVFVINTNNLGFTNVYSFTATSGTYLTNDDGANPIGGVIVSGNTLYGAAQRGGKYGNGTVFALNIDSTGFTVLHTFTAGNPNSDGQGPSGGLVLLGNTLYGTTQFGSASGAGTVFSLSISPQLEVVLSETNLILMWPTNYAGFDYTGYTLQSTTNLEAPKSWAAVSPGPTLVNGQYAFTNSVTASAQFFRLSQ